MLSGVNIFWWLCNGPTFFRALAIICALAAQGLLNFFGGLEVGELCFYFRCYVCDDGVGVGEVGEGGDSGPGTMRREAGGYVLSDKGMLVVRNLGSSRITLMEI